MTRTLARELAQKVNETITIEGWLHKKRLLGGLNFITLRDRSGLAQSLISNKDELEKLRGLQIGTVLSITGTVVADEKSRGVVEIAVDRLRERNPVDSLQRAIVREPNALDGNRRPLTNLISRGLRDPRRLSASAGR